MSSGFLPYSYSPGLTISAFVCLHFAFHILSSVGPMPVSSFSRSHHLSFYLPRFRFHLLSSVGPMTVSSFSRSHHLSFCLPPFRFHLLSSVGPMPVSSFSRSRHLSFGLPRFRFPYTVIYRASYNDLFLTNTFCPHKPSRRWAWHSPNGKTHNQIDYIMVKKRFRSSVNINRTRILTHH